MGGPREHSLDALVGDQRAAILRLVDETPATCGVLARTLFVVPGGVTHHVRSLEAAGLVRRTRQGRSVVVELTARGRRLRALYEPPSAAGDGPIPRGATVPA